MIRRYFDALTRWHTIGLAVLVLGLALYSVSVIPPPPGVNAWDLLFPVLSETSTVVLLGLLWWSLTLAPVLSRLRHPEVLIRFGSPARAARNAMRRLLPAALAGMTAMAAPATIVAGQWGMSWSWSGQAHSLRELQPAPSAFGSAELIRHFETPTVALAATILYTLAAYLVIGALAVALTLHWSPRAAIVALSLLYVWASIRSFIVDYDRPSITSAISLPWALHPSTLPAAALGTAIALAFSMLLIRTPPGALGSRLQRMLSNRGALLLPVAAAFLLALAANTGARSPRSQVGEVFIGAHGDIIGYAAGMLLVLTTATASVLRIGEHAESTYVQVAIRLGGPARWVLRMLAAEAPWLIGTAAATVLAALAGAAITRASFIDPATLLDWLPLLMAAVAVQLLCYSAIGLALLWFVPLGRIWAAVLGAALILGYAAPPESTAANPFAAFSMHPDAAAASPIWIGAAGALGAAALAIALIAAVRRRSPVLD